LPRRHESAPRPAVLRPRRRPLHLRRPALPAPLRRAALPDGEPLPTVLAHDARPAGPRPRLRRDADRARTARARRRHRPGVLRGGALAAGGRPLARAAPLPPHPRRHLASLPGVGGHRGGHGTAAPGPAERAAHPGPVATLAPPRRPPG